MVFVLNRNLNTNELSGPFPHSLAAATSLRELFLFFQYISTSLPSLFLICFSFSVLLRRISYLALSLISLPSNAWKYCTSSLSFLFFPPLSSLLPFPSFFFPFPLLPFP